MGPRPRIPELSGTPGLDPEEGRRARKQRVPPHSLDRHAEDDGRVEKGPRDPGDHRHDRRFGHRGPHQRGPPREPPRVRRDEGPGHARRALDRDAPGVLEVLNIDAWTSPLGSSPFSFATHSARTVYAVTICIYHHDFRWFTERIPRLMMRSCFLRWKNLRSKVEARRVGS